LKSLRIPGSLGLAIDLISDGIHIAAQET
jgi:hypothetical protein